MVEFLPLKWVSQPLLVPTGQCEKLIGVNVEIESERSSFLNLWKGLRWSGSDAHSNKYRLEICWQNLFLKAQPCCEVSFRWKASNQLQRAGTTTMPSLKRACYQTSYYQLKSSLQFIRFGWWYCANRRWSRKSHACHCTMALSTTGRIYMRCMTCNVGCNGEQGG